MAWEWEWFRRGLPGRGGGRETTWGYRVEEEVTCPVETAVVSARVLGRENVTCDDR